MRSKRTRSHIVGDFDGVGFLEVGKAYPLLGVIIPLNEKLPTACGFPKTALNTSVGGVGSLRRERVAVGAMIQDPLEANKGEAIIIDLR